MLVKSMLGELHTLTTKNFFHSTLNVTFLKKYCGQLQVKNHYTKFFAIQTSILSA